jgi:hypothetical protein
MLFGYILQNESIEKYRTANHKLKFGLKIITILLVSLITITIIFVEIINLNVITFTAFSLVIFNSFLLFIDYFAYNNIIEKFLTSIYWKPFLVSLRMAYLMDAIIMVLIFDKL